LKVVYLEKESCYTGESDGHAKMFIVMLAQHPSRSEALNQKRDARDQRHDSVSGIYPPGHREEIAVTEAFTKALQSTNDERKRDIDRSTTATMNGLLRSFSWVWRELMESRRVKNQQGQYIPKVSMLKIIVNITGICLIVC
jgi:hypothetical protein